MRSIIEATPPGADRPMTAAMMEVLLEEAGLPRAMCKRLHSQVSHTSLLKAEAVVLF